METTASVDAQRPGRTGKEEVTAGAGTETLGVWTPSLAQRCFTCRFYHKPSTGVPGNRVACTELNRLPDLSVAEPPRV